MTVEPPPANASGARREALLLVMLIAIEVFAVTETAMAFAAVPTFMRVFEVDAAAVGWTTTAYLLVGAGSAATCGRLGDIFGRKRILTLILLGAAAGSLVSALAVDLWMVILGRGLQGLSAGAIAISIGLIRELLPAPRVPVAIALLGGIVPISSGIGALLAGVLLDLSGWRLMFGVAVVLGIGSALISYFGLPPTTGITPRPTVDIVGAVLLVPATAGVLFGLTKGNVWGWTDGGVLLPIGFGLVALSAWIWWELRVPEPIVDMRQFRNRKVGLTTVATILIGMGPMGALAMLAPMILQLPKETSIGHGLTPTTAGVVQLALCVVCYVGAWSSGWIAARVGARWSLATACVLYIAGTCLWFFMTDSLAGTIICLGVTLIGQNMSYPAMPNLIVESVPPEQTGAANGMNRVTLNFGVAAGTSVIGVILSANAAAGSHLPTESALYAGFVFIIATSTVGLVLALLIGGRHRPAESGMPRAATRGTEKTVA
ncbi:MFS transporter [Nocardia sp. NPDC051750]|uniref:MFS transporter n=1 Tax=Nocardia sp. NPDC051750 TaxID=3364325 RepID=UPI0037AE8DDB